MVANIHNTRILRFLLVIGAVVLTIFIYASYSTSPQLAPAHMHSHISLPPEALQQQYAANNKSGELNASNNAENQGRLLFENHHVHQGAKRRNMYGYGNALDNGMQTKKHHRQPTVDVDAGGSDIPSNNIIEDGPPEEAVIVGNYFLEEQYLSNVENAMGNINGSSGVTTGGDVALNNGKISEQKPNNDKDQNNESQQLIKQQQLQQQVQLQEQPQKSQQPQQHSQDINNKEIKDNSNKAINTNNKVMYSDVLIPTSNLQKFIENADKILKNMTAASTSISNNLQPEQVPHDGKQQVQHQQDNKPDEELKKANEVKRDGDGDTGEDYDDSQNQSVIMTIKSASKIEEERKQVGDRESGKGQVIKAPENIQEEKKPFRPSMAESALRVAISQSTQNKITSEGEELKRKGETLLPVKPPVPQAPIKNVPAKNLTATTPNKPLDASQGIPTQQLYESGHLDEELDMEKICPSQGSDLKLLILITSAQSHGEARMAIRQTWGHYGSRRDVSTAFVLGRSANRTLNLALSKENFIYGDLIRGNFIDSYNNLTLKTISSLEWVDRHCSRAKFILKTDDDMFINVPKLLQFLDSHSKDKRTIYGRLAKKWKPVRNKKSKYYVSTTQFSAAVFPSFTTGPAYVLTSDIVHDLYVRSLQQVYFKLEDVFTTGIVAQQLNIKRIHVNEFLNRRIAFNPCNIRKTISVHMIKANEQFDLWKKLLDQTTKCK